MKNKITIFFLLALASAIAIVLFVVTMYLNNTQNLSLDVISGILGLVVSLLTSYLAGTSAANAKLDKEILELKTSVNLLSNHFYEINKERPRVFISYSHSDKEKANKIIRMLQGLNFDIVTYENILIRTGDNIKSKIEDALNESEFVLFLISKNWIKSQYANNELKQAIRKNKKIIPLLLEETKLPSELNKLKYEKIDSNFRYNLKEILNVFKFDLEHNKIGNALNGGNHIATA